MAKLFIKSLFAVLFCLQLLESAPLSYSALPLSDKEALAIKEIVTTLGKPRWGKYIYLAAKTFHLKGKGVEAEQVHPLRFLGFICADSKLRDYLKNIKDDSWVWPQFIGPLGEALGKKAKDKTLTPYLRGFAEELCVDQNRVEAYINENNFDGLVDYLTN